MTFLLKLGALCGLVLLVLGAYPGVLGDVLFTAILLSPLVILVMAAAGAVYLLVKAVARRRATEPGPDLGDGDIGAAKRSPAPLLRWLILSPTILILCVVLIDAGIPIRVAFLLSRP